MIKLSDYIKNLKEAISEEEWFELYKRAYMDNSETEEEFAEKLIHVSLETDELLEERR